jgi:hypothetical protein
MGGVMSASDLFLNRAVGDAHRRLGLEVVAHGLHVVQLDDQQLVVKVRRVHEEGHARRARQLPVRGLALFLK